MRLEWALRRWAALHVIPVRPTSSRIALSMLSGGRKHLTFPRLCSGASCWRAVNMNLPSGRRFSRVRSRRLTGMYISSPSTREYMGTFLRAGDVSLNRISWELSRSSSICPRRSRMSWARSAMLVSGMYLLNVFTGSVIALDGNNRADDGSVQEHLPLLSQDHQRILDECAFREHIPASIIPVVVLAVLGGMILELTHCVFPEGRDNQWGCALEQGGWPVVRGVFCDGISPYNIDGLDPVAGHGAVKGVDRAGALEEPPTSFVGIYTVGDYFHYAETALMTAKLIIIAPVSAVLACKFVRVMSKEPEATAVTMGTDVAAVWPDRADNTTGSPIATAELVT